MKVSSGKPTVTLFPWVHFSQVVLGSDVLRPLQAAPLEDSRFKDIDAMEKTAEEWHARKLKSFDQNLEEQRLDHVATGGMDADLGTVV